MLREPGEMVRLGFMHNMPTAWRALGHGPYRHSSPMGPPPAFLEVLDRFVDLVSRMEVLGSIRQMHEDATPLLRTGVANDLGRLACRCCNPFRQVAGGNEETKGCVGVQWRLLHASEIGSQLAEKVPGATLETRRP